MMLEESEQAGNKRGPERPRPKPTPPRRDYTLDKKLQVVRETLTPGASVSVVARRHDINTNVVFRWRRQYMRGEMVKIGMEEGQPQLSPAFVPVGVVGHGELRALAAPQQKQHAVLQEKALTEPGCIEIETALGVKVRVTGRVDDRALNLVLAEIRRRP
jgi:transposase